MMMMSVLGLVISFLLAQTTLVLGKGYPLHQQSFVVPLTDDNFEHETQASTGGTTGSWLVWFHSTRDETFVAGEIPEPDFWSDNHVVLASLDATKYRGTRSRFNVSKTPAFRFIHKGKYYRLDKPDNKYIFNWSKLKQFVTEDYATMEAFDIPPPRTFYSFLEDLVWFLDKARQEFGGVYLYSLIAYFAFFMLIALISKVVSKAQAASMAKRTSEKLKKS